MTRKVRAAVLAHLAAAAAFLLAACGQSPPSWDNLLSGKVLGQYPTYTVTVPVAGQLRVERPGMPTNKKAAPRQNIHKQFREMELLLDPA